MAANFRSLLQATCMGIAQTTVSDTVKTFDKYLHDIALDQFPYIATTVRQAERHGPGEIGTTNQMYDWTVHLYYLDTTTTYDVGEARRDDVVNRLVSAFEKSPRLNNLADVSSPVHFTVYNSYWEAILFDSSGQDGYYTFVSELYLTVETARS